MEEIKDIDVQLENGEIVPGEVELTKEGARTAPKKPTRAEIRAMARNISRVSSKHSQKENDIKMKNQARDMRKLRRKPSNFAKGAE